MLRKAAPDKLNYLFCGMGFQNGVINLKKNLDVLPEGKAQSLVSLCEEVLLIGQEWGQSVQAKDVFVKNMKVLNNLEKSIGFSEYFYVEHMFCEKSKTGCHVPPVGYCIVRSKEMEEMKGLY